MTTQQILSENALHVKETEPFSALVFTTQTTLRTINKHSHAPKNLCLEADRLSLTPTGPIQYMYTGVNGDEASTFQLAIALPIQQPGKQPDGFDYQLFPAFQCASYTHTGSWNDFPELYDTLFAQLYGHGYQNNGHIREIYLVIDSENLANCVTEIQIGID